MGGITLYFLILSYHHFSGCCFVERFEDCPRLCTVSVFMHILSKCKVASKKWNGCKFHGALSGPGVPLNHIVNCG